MNIVRQVAHVCMLTHDLAASEAFYCGVLGLKKAFEFSKDGRRIGLYIEAGARTWIEIFSHADAPFPTLGAINHFCLEVNSIDEAIAHIRAKGVEITDKKYGVDDTWQAWIKGPSGERIELFEYTPKSAQFVGGDRIADW
jgi:lactoylglutathione lyase/glyoxylase I family protein